MKLVANEIQYLTSSVLRYEKRKKDGILLFTLTNYGQILICKFLEIWTAFNSLAGENERVREVCRAGGPVIDRIRIWPKLRNFRNTMLAHAYAAEDEVSLVLPWGGYERGAAPHHTVETLLLLSCATFLCVGALAAFGSEHRALKPILDSVGEEAPPAVRGASTDVEAQREHDRLLAEFDGRLRAIGVDPSDPVFREFGDTARQIINGKFEGEPP